MKEISVLGSGCAKCTKTAELIEETARAMGCEVDVTKQTDPAVIMGYGVMSTPAVVIDGQLVHSGSMPLRAQIEQWLAD
ncbi:thioredoxin family protein [Nitrogeniibacter mangrovi]|uniref:Thioredoxin family protein n=1 Tax=Nitrogeniibacter mangrovi TaxID=2016596 RepID=A0A6C1B5K9_9RHOO|nr:thioredoxin family protein [Nitrogeniibacter mangrovi]QID17988.1 thioredoxin family protein [Nitrogeniibacter mangrovi]